MSDKASSETEMYSCPRFDYCNAPRCPLDPMRDRRVRLKGEPRCRRGGGKSQGLRCDICGTPSRSLLILPPPVEAKDIVDHEVNEGGVYAITGGQGRSSVAWRYHRVCALCMEDLRKEGRGIVRLKFKYNLEEAEDDGSDRAETQDSIDTSAQLDNCGCAV